MAPHSSILAWEILWEEEPGGLQFMGLQRIGHDWATEQQNSNYNFKRYFPSLKRMPLKRKVRKSRGECIDFQRCILNKENSVSDLLFRKHLIKCLFIPSHVLDAKATKMNHVWPCPWGAHCLVKEKEMFKYTSQFRDAAVLEDEWSQREERSFQPGWCWVKDRVWGGWECIC